MILAVLCILVPVCLFDTEAKPLIGANFKMCFNIKDVPSVEFSADINIFPPYNDTDNIHCVLACQHVCVNINDEWRIDAVSDDDK